MRKSPALRPHIILCLVALIIAGCGGKEASNATQRTANPDAVVAEMNSFTNELLEKVDAAGDPSAGVDEAQKLMDARKDSLKSRIVAARASEEFRESQEAQGKFLDSEIDNRDRVSAIRKRHLDRWVKDAEFKAKLDRLERDYHDLFEQAGASAR